jgi:hypothetical protein
MLVQCCLGVLSLWLALRWQAQRMSDENNSRIYFWRTHDWKRRKERATKE